ELALEFLLKYPERLQPLTPQSPPDACSAAARRDASTMIRHVSPTASPAPSRTTFLSPSSGLPTRTATCYAASFSSGRPLKPLAKRAARRSTLDARAFLPRTQRPKVDSH